MNTKEKTLTGLVGILSFAAVAPFAFGAMSDNTQTLGDREGMRGQGHTVTAVLLPSQSRLYVLPELDCVNKTDEEALTQLAFILTLKY